MPPEVIKYVLIAVTIFSYATALSALLLAYILGALGALR